MNNVTQQNSSEVSVESMASTGTEAIVKLKMKCDQQKAEIDRRNFLIDQLAANVFETNPELLTKLGITYTPAKNPMPVKDPTDQKSQG